MSDREYAAGVAVFSVLVTGFYAALYFGRRRA
jgi:hypothetical protein